MLIFSSQGICKIVIKNILNEIYKVHFVAMKLTNDYLYIGYSNGGPGAAACRAPAPLWTLGHFNIIVSRLGTFHMGNRRHVCTYDI